MKIRIKKNQIYDYLLITIGTMLLAGAISVFYSPNDMVTGGVSGLSIILKSFAEAHGIPFPLWLSNLALNVPIFLVGGKVRGFKFLTRTLFATLFLSLALYIAKYFPVYTADLFISSIFGGVMSGVGLGLVFRAMATTGGTDLASSIINKYIPHFSLQKILFMLDSSIIILGLFVFGPTKALYAIVTVYVSTKVVDAILEGMEFAKAIFIISSKPEEISKDIMQKLERGVTSLYGKGMYSGNDKNILLCITSVKEIIQLKTIVVEIDPDSFIIVADVREVIGEGFKQVA